LQRGRHTQRSVPKPPLAEVRRERLLERLTRAGDERLIAFIAPSGYGKTTLLTQFARSSVDTVVWLSLTEEHLDVGALQTDLGVACSDALGWSALAREEMTAIRLARRLNAHPENVHLVLDGVDHLSEMGGRWLEQFVTELAEGNRVLVSGYAEPPLRFSALVASGRAWAIGAEELAFTLEEASSYLSARGSTEHTQHWHAALEGWPAGLALTASGARHVHPKRLAEEAVAQLEPMVRDALPEAAVLLVWSEAAALEMGCTLPEGWLEVVRRKGLPLTPLGDGAFRPHLILRETLRAQLQRRPERWTALHRRAAQMAKDAGDFITALRCFQASGELETALDLARQLCEGYAQRLEFTLVADILGGFPGSALDATLNGLLGQALIQIGQVERGEAMLRALLETGRADSRTWYTLGLLASRRGQNELQLEYARRGQHVSEGQHLDLRSLELDALHALRRTDVALEMAQHFAARAEETGNRLELAMMLDQIQFFMRDDQPEHRHSRRTMLERALALFTALDMPARALRSQNQLADLLRLDGQAHEALRIIEAALPVAVREESRTQMFLLETRGDAWAWLGEHERAQVDFEAALQQARKFSMNAFLTRLLCKRAVSLLHLNDTVNARLCLETARLEAPGAGLEADQFLAFANGVRCWLEGAHRAAELEFRRVAPGGTDATLFVRAQAFRAALTRGASAHTAALKRCLKTLDAFGADDVLLGDLGALRPWIATLAKTHPQQTRWRRLLEPRAAFTPSTVRLEVRTLGTAEMLIEDTPIATPSVRALEVLSYLAMHGPSARDRIVDALWSEEAQVSAINYFKVLIRRLRAALQNHPAIRFDPLPFTDGVYRIDERLEVSHDAVTLLTQLRRDDADVRTALEVYRGAFLGDAESAWAESVRQRCLETLVVKALQAARTLEDRQPGVANRLFQSVIELDPLSEAAYDGLVRTHLRLGQLEHARNAYKRLERMLAAEFRSRPSAELQRAVFGSSLV
jgi:LuxR family transcriptional regulator, maltose regulon positive regulatory protein